MTCADKLLQTQTYRHHAAPPHGVKNNVDFTALSDTVWPLHVQQDMSQDRVNKSVTSTKAQCKACQQQHVHPRHEYAYMTL